jgi:hypothetical protein
MGVTGGRTHGRPRHETGRRSTGRRITRTVPRDERLCPLSKNELQNVALGKGFLPKLLLLSILLHGTSTNMSVAQYNETTLHKKYFITKNNSFLQK